VSSVITREVNARDREASYEAPRNRQKREIQSVDRHRADG